MKTVNRIGMLAAFLPLLWYFAVQSSLPAIAEGAPRIELLVISSVSLIKILLKAFLVLGCFLALGMRFESVRIFISAPKTQLAIASLFILASYIFAGLVFNVGNSLMVALLIPAGLLFFAARRLVRAGYGTAIAGVFPRLFAFLIGSLLGTVRLVLEGGILSLTPPALVAVAVILLTKPEPR